MANASVLVGVIILSLVIASLPVMYCTSDAMNCYRVGLAMLADGWNPIYESEVDQIAAIGSGFNPWHVAYGFKFQWIVGAALCKAVGNSMVGDATNVMLCIAAFCIVFDWLLGIFSSRRLAAFFAGVLCLSPNVIRLMIGGKTDPVMYEALLIFLVACELYRAQRSRICFVVAPMCGVLMMGVKATGLVNFIVIGLVYLGTFLAMMLCKRMSRRQAGMFAGLVLVSILCAILFNPSPVVTSWVKHGTPLYPMRTVDGGEVPQEITHLTGDCDIMNADAKSLGAFARYVRAYISETAVDSYKTFCLKRTFRPEWPALWSPPNGYGAFFRVAFVVALICWFLVKDVGLRIMAVAVLLTTFCVPTKFVGMGHYVQQIYLIPLFVALGLVFRWREEMRLRFGVYVGVWGYAMILCLPQLKFIPYVWLTSVQNLQILDEVQRDECPLIESRNYYGQYLWRHDAACNVKIVGPEDLGDVSGWQSYGAAARRYNYWRKTEMPTSFYDFSFNDAGYDQVKRRKGAGTYFARKFLPGEIRHGYKRFGQWFNLRCRQLRTAWTGG